MMKPKLMQSMLLLAVGLMLLYLVACGDTRTTSPSELPQFENKNSVSALQMTFDKVTAVADAKQVALAARETARLTFESSIRHFEEIIDSAT